MKTLDTSIRVRLKFKEKKWGHFLLSSAEDSIAHTVHEIIKILNEAEKIGIYFLPNV